MTLAAHGALRDRSAPDWRVAGFGVSREVPGYRQLASVQEELSGIVQTEPGGEGIYPGEISLDEASTEERLANALETHEAVHIASHLCLTRRTASVRTCSRRRAPSRRSTDCEIEASIFARSN